MGIREIVVFFSEVLKNDFGRFSHHCATIFELQICRLVIVEYLVGEWMALASCWHPVLNRFAPSEPGGRIIGTSW